MSRYLLTHLKQLEAESIHIIREVAAEFENPVMMYSIGKDSSVMVRLAMKAFHPGPLPFPLLHIDTGWKFRDMIAFRDAFCREHGLRLIVHTNDAPEARALHPVTAGSKTWTDVMKTQGLLQALTAGGFDAAFGGARRDEEKSRAKERVYSFRDQFHQWDPKNQRPELWNLYNGRIHKGETIRVFPLSNWTELDVWQYVHLEHIPVVPLYFAAPRPVVERDGNLIMVDDERLPLGPGEQPQSRVVRFRTLGCYPFSGAVESSATTLPGIIQEMLLARTSERQGRMIDYDEAGSMEQKKKEGVLLMLPDSELIATDIDAYLAQHERKELVRFLTCGSVDDGKSTLIGRLLYDTRTIYDDQLAAVRKDSERRGRTGGDLDLSLLTDGLKAEREQGITIDVAYRYFSTARRKFIIADTPGHEQYTRNMATGASTCDVAIILVDARNGVAPQTRRHSFIASLLGIRHVIVAINKMDLVEYSEEVFDRITEAYAEFAVKLEFTDLRFIPVSALHGDNVVEPSNRMAWYRGETLLHYLDTVHVSSDRNLIDFRFPVQYVNRPHLDFRGFAGTIASGVVRPGDEVVALPSGARSRVRTVVTGEGEQPEAFAPMAVTLTLTDEIDVSRGDTLVRPENLPRVDRNLDAMVVWMADEALRPGRQYWIKHAASLVTGTVSSLRYRIDVNSLQRQDAAALQINEVGRCVLTLSRPVAFDAYRQNRATGAFILIDRISNGTVGAGMIVDRSNAPGFLRDNWDDDTFAALQAMRSSQVTSAERAGRYGHAPLTVLLTGLPGSGKTTIAYALERRLFEMGRAVTVLDGRQMRSTISKGLGFTAAERSENLRRAIDVARFMNEAGLICICAFVAPSAAVRERARQAVASGRFVEIHLSAPLETCRARDETGSYASAEAGELLDFPGVSAPYDVPVAPDLSLDTGTLTVAECVERIVKVLSDRLDPTGPMRA